LLVYNFKVLQIKKELPADSRILVGSSDEFQGLEASIVLISLVRCTDAPPAKPTGSLGFLAMPERINSIVTRAQHQVIIVGSADHFDEGYCRFWDGLLDMATVKHYRD
jgi:superfamily I DNA and/or RNA helicase